jgi:hypothetical protein
MMAGDRYLKRLHSFLSQYLTIRQLRTLGWFDFQSLDRPEVEDVIAVACEAFLYLSLTSEETWNGVTGVLTAVVAFLKEETNQLPLASQAQELKSLLEATPVDSDAIREWFQKVYH